MSEGAGQDVTSDSYHLTFSITHLQLDIASGANTRLATVVSKGHVQEPIESTLLIRCPGRQK